MANAMSYASCSLKAASVSGFEVLAIPEGRWPKLRHRETNIDLDILPEGGRPGTVSRPAPTTIPHPKSMGASRGTLKYSSLPSLIELKLPPTISVRRWIEARQTWI